MSYSDPIYMSYVAPANAAVSTEADIFSFIGPAGKTGRVVACSLVTTTATTAAAAALSIGIKGGDEDVIGQIAVPITAIDTKIPVSLTQIAALGQLAADTAYWLHGGGEATAGALDICLTIAWS